MKKTEKKLSTSGIYIIIFMLQWNPAKADTV